MPRDSAKRSPRVDDELKHETEGMIRGGGPTHVEEWRQPEPTGEPPASAQMPPERQGGGVDMTAREVEWRSQIAQVLAPLDYPADRGKILAFLERNHAPGNVVTAMTGLPKDRKFHNVGEIARAIGIHTEQHRI
ncbi:Protein of unknown function [Thermomonospora echinospora]|uniref:DUF2795 domain-containing protein n=1 Tax=Thermomonospora echinospora TaxID=1992 RepID=A0A1H6E631_9ACTN|nr:DUF2795 domain-containing protein [Thermomonospora echinospora]SEG93152.1 Protein of unknown function [Thermomonospora echinospora]